MAARRLSAEELGGLDDLLEARELRLHKTVAQLRDRKHGLSGGRARTQRAVSFQFWL